MLLIDGDSSENRAGSSPLAHEASAWLEIGAKHWALGAAVFVISLVLAVVWLLQIDPSYRASTTIIPTSLIVEGQSLPLSSTLAGLSNRLGLGVTQPSGSATAAYPAVMRSRGFFNGLAERSFRSRGGDPITIHDMLGTTDLDSLRMIDKSFQRYRDEALRIAVDDRTGAMTVTVVLDDPVAAASLANACVERLADEIMRIRRAHDGEWIDFLEGRARQSRLELSAAEDSLEIFLARNRSVMAPALVMQQSRLLRDLEVRQEVYLTVRGQLESALMQSKNNVNSTTVLENAVPPMEPFRPRRALMLLVALILSTGLSLLAVISRHFVGDVLVARVLRR